MDELRLTIHGTVQGVFFRATIKRWAKELGLTGYAQNLSNGAVEVVAQGERQQLEDLKARCSNGPQYATVTQMNEAWSTAKQPLTSFEIR